ncbi:MAG: hypothetical protein Q7S02_03425, partial [bacterium]|nr:hypothetical protein [bacterium]
EVVIQSVTMLRAVRRLSTDRVTWIRCSLCTTTFWRTAHERCPLICLAVAVVVYGVAYLVRGFSHDSATAVAGDTAFACTGSDACDTGLSEPGERGR